MAMSRNGQTAACLSVFGTVLVLVAFASKNWIVADGESDPKVDSIGLWQVCFRNYEDPRHLYDTKFENCWWVFAKKQYVIHDFILKGFYSSTQILFSVSAVFSVFSLFYTVMYMCFKLSPKRLIRILCTIWGLQLASAIFGTVSLIIFGVHGISRDWFPEWEHKYIGWSYVVAVIGISFLYISVILFFIEERVRKVKSRKPATKSENFDPKQLLSVI